MATNLARGWAYKKLARCRFYPPGTPSLVEEAETEGRTQHGWSQDRPRAVGHLPSLEGIRIREDFL